MSRSWVERPISRQVHAIFQTVRALLWASMLLFLINYMCRGGNLWESVENLLECGEYSEGSMGNLWDILMEDLWKVCGKIAEGITKGEWL